MPQAASNKSGPGSNKPGPGNVGTKGTGTKTSEPKKVKVSQDDRDIFQEILAKEREISPWSAVILPTFAVLLLGGGIACIIVGGVKDIPDLIVLGVMFLIGAVVFGFMMFVAVCRPCCSRNQVNTFEDFETTQAYKPPPTPTDYFNADFDDDLTQARNKPGPPENELYGKARSKLSTPATVTNVHFESETDTSYGSPPPPPVAIPRETGERGPVYNLDVDTAAKRNQEMSDLMLL